MDALALELQAYDWNCVLHTTDIDTVYERFRSVIADLISRTIPVIPLHYEIVPRPTSRHLSNIC